MNKFYGKSLLRQQRLTDGITEPSSHWTVLLDASATPRIRLELLKARCKILNLQRLELVNQKENLTRAIDKGELDKVETSLLIDLYDDLAGGFKEIMKQTDKTLELTNSFIQEVQQENDCS